MSTAKEKFELARQRYAATFERHLDNGVEFISDNVYIEPEVIITPVTVGDHAFTAAGSTIGHDVPAGALSIERAKQTEIDNWGENKLQKYIAKKQKLEADKKNK